MTTKDVLGAIIIAAILAAPMYLVWYVL